jgi:hypothetical protein
MKLWKYFDFWLVYYWVWGIFYEIALRDHLCIPWLFATIVSSSLVLGFAVWLYMVST